MDISEVKSDAIPVFGQAPEYNNVVSDAFFYLNNNINIKFTIIIVNT